MLILLIGLLSACGQSGNLYLPEKNNPTSDHQPQN